MPPQLPAFFNELHSSGGNDVADPIMQPTDELSADKLDKVTGGDFSFQLFGYQVDYVDKTHAGSGPHGDLAIIHNITITIGPAPPKPA
jgi:hypothetical protein